MAVRWHIDVVLVKEWLSFTPIYIGVSSNWSGRLLTITFNSIFCFSNIEIEYQGQGLSNADLKIPLAKI